MNEKKLLIGLGAVVGVLVLAIIAVTAVIIAQGGGGGSSQSGTGGTASARVSGELRLPGDDPLTLDPALVTDVTSATYIVELFGGLVTLDKDLQVKPDIAKSWDVSPDGTKYTFHLRDDVVFSQSGRRVTAQDFKYSMERAARPETDSPTADTYLGDIVGAKDMIRGRAKEISGIRVVDDFTLEITIDAPKPYFLAKLTYPTAFVVNKDQIEKDKRNWTRKPDGTGPFKLQEWKIGERIVLVRPKAYTQTGHVSARGGVLTYPVRERRDRPGRCWGQRYRAHPRQEREAQQGVRGKARPQHLLPGLQHPYTAL